MTSLDIAVNPLRYINVQDLCQMRSPAVGGGNAGVLHCNASPLRFCTTQPAIGRRGTPGSPSLPPDDAVQSVSPDIRQPRSPTSRPVDIGRHVLSRRYVNSGFPVDSEMLLARRNRLHLSNRKDHDV